MAHPEIALAASARDWSDRLHRFLLDHGGGTVRVRVMSADQAISSAYDVLLIDDICSFLTPRLVVELRRSGRAVVGVFAPDDGPDAKRRLLEVGITDVVEADAGPEEFLRSVAAAVLETPEAPIEPADTTRQGFVIGVTGSPGGVGVTEISIGLALGLSRNRNAALVDLNQGWPAIGQRLNLPVHPNLRTAVDLCLHEPGRLPDAMHSHQGLNIVSGLANPESGALPSSEIVTLIKGLSTSVDHVVLDLGSGDGWNSDLLLRNLDTALVVGLADPMGITRLVRTAESVALATRDCELGIVVNRVPRFARQRDEVVGQIKTSLGDIPIVLLPEDGRIDRARWDGLPVDSGPFQRQIRRLSAVFDGVSV